MQVYPSDLPRLRSLICRLAGNGLIPSTGYDREPEESLLTSGPPYQKFGAPRKISESVARQVRQRRAEGESLRMISQRMNIKLGGVRSVLRRDCPRARSSARIETAPPGGPPAVGEAGAEPT